MSTADDAPCDVMTRIVRSPVDPTRWTKLVGGGHCCLGRDAPSCARLILSASHSVFALVLIVRLIPPPRRRQLHVSTKPALRQLCTANSICALPALGAAGAAWISRRGVVAVASRRDASPGRPRRDREALRLGVGDDTRIALRLAELDQADVVVKLALRLAHGFYGGVEAPPFAHHLLRRGRVVPEVRILAPRVQLGEAALGDIPVKDASGSARRRCGSRRPASQSRHLPNPKRKGADLAAPQNLRKIREPAVPVATARRISARRRQAAHRILVTDMDRWRAAVPACRIPDHALAAAIGLSPAPLDGISEAGAPGILGRRIGPRHLMTR